MLKYKISTGLLCLLVLIFSAAAYSHTLVVYPDKAWIDHGEGIQFTAQAFNDLGVPVDVDDLEWSVTPALAGAISNDGYFIGGESYAHATVTAAARVKGDRITGDATVIVGVSPDPEIRIVVEPEEAFVAPLDTVHFKAIAVGPDGMSLRMDGVRWNVQPRNVGLINDDGVFVAGARFAEGKVMAFVEIENQMFKGETDVLVSAEPTGAITGVITDTDGSAISNARVSVIRLGTPAQRKSDSTDVNGQYEIGNLVPGNFVVLAEADGYITEFYDNVTQFSQTTPVSVGEDETVSDIDFDLGTGGSISGTITDESTGGPLSGVQVTAGLAVNPLRRYHATTDENGNYTLRGLSSGSYALHFNKRGYIAEYYDNVRLPEDVTPVSVTAPGAVTGIDAALTLTQALTGIVTSDVDGSPITGAIVAVRALLAESDAPNRNAYQFMHTARTDEHGEFTIQLAPGFYLVYIRAEDFVPEWYDDAVSPYSGTPVQIFAEQHTAISVGLAPFGSISGTVTDAATGNIIAGARVNAYYDRDLYGYPRKYTVFSNDQGEYVFPSIPTGDFYVAAHADSYLVEFWQEADSLASATAVTVESGMEVTGIDFTLSNGGTISGSVTEAENDVPLAGAIVSVEKTDGRLRRQAKADENGNYAISGLPAGSYVAVARCRNYIREWYLEKPTHEEADEIVLGISDTVDDINFTLEAMPTTDSGISGIVLEDSSDIPIEGAMVVLVPLDFAKPQRAYSGPDGSFEINNAQPGRYIAVCRAPGYIGEFYDNVSTWFEAETITIEEGVITPDINFSLNSQAEGVYSIMGKVTDNVGNAGEDVLVVAKQADQIVAAEVTESDGSYLMYGIPSGQYSLMITGANHEDSWYNGESETDAETLTVGDEQQVYNVSMVLGNESTDVTESGTVPAQFELEQNYPNPFNPSTTIRFALPAAGNVKLTIFNLLGKEVRTILNSTRQAGAYTVTWDGTDNQGMRLASGIYIYRLEVRSGNEVYTDHRRMLLIK